MPFAVEFVVGERRGGTVGAFAKYARLQTMGILAGDLIFDGGRNRDVAGWNSTSCAVIRVPPPGKSGRGLRWP